MSKALRLLFIEDSEDDVLLLVREVKRGGYEPIYERVDTLSAMETALKQKTWDIIISDYAMPRFSAPAALALLKETGLDLPFIIVSGKIGEDTAVAAMKAGAHDYIMKDNLARLIPSIERELNDAEVRRGRMQAEKSLEKATRALRTLSECNEALVREKTESELLNKICRIIIEKGGYRLAWIGFAEHDKGKTVRPVAQCGYEKGYLDTINITWADSKRGRGPTGTAIRTGKPGIAGNILTEPRFIPWRAEAKKRGYASSISIPLINKEQSFGALNIYATEPDAFDDKEITLLTQLANNLSYGITSIRISNERIEAEDALKDSEAKFRAIFDNATDGILLADTENKKFISGNKSICGMLGYSPEEIINLSVLDIHPEKDIPYIIDQFDRQARGELITATSIPVKRKNGSVFYADINSSSLSLSGSVYLIGIFRDITERKEAEEELLKKELQWSHAMDYIEDAVYLIDLDDKVIQANRPFYQLTGLTPEQTIGKDIAGIIHPNGESVPCPVCIARRDRRDAIIRMEADHPDNPTGRPIEVMVKIVRDKSGKPVSVMKAIRDLTPLENLRRHAQIIDQVHDSVVTTDMEGVIMDWNNGAERLFGYTAEEAIGRNVSFIHPEDQHDLLEDKVIKPLQAKGVNEREVKLRRKNGEIFYAILSLSLLRNPDGVPIGMIGSSIDITERRNIEKERQKLNKELLQKNRELQESNTALKVLLGQRENDKIEFEENILSNIKHLVLPYIEKLKTKRRIPEEIPYIKLIESNLNDIVSPFSSRMSSRYLGFTPKEIQIANLIKEGDQDKDISNILHISVVTVKTHRQNIRKKLGIYGKKINLRTHLLSFSK